MQAISGFIVLPFSPPQCLRFVYGAVSVCCYCWCFHCCFFWIMNSIFFLVKWCFCFVFIFIVRRISIDCTFFLFRSPLPHPNASRCWCQMCMKRRHCHFAYLRLRRTMFSLSVCHCSAVLPFCAGDDGWIRIFQNFYYVILAAIASALDNVHAFFRDLSLFIHRLYLQSLLIFFSLLLSGVWPSESTSYLPNHIHWVKSIKFYVPKIVSCDMICDID